MKKLRITWFDDQAARVRNYVAPIETGPPGKGRGAKLEVIELKGDVLDVLGKWLARNEGSPPNLVIFDHVLNAAAPFRAKGASLAHLLRATLPEVPIVCVTAMFDRANAFDQEDLSEYTAVFTFGELANHIEDMYAIARDFGKLMPNSRADVRAHLVGALQASRRDEEDLLASVPEEFRTQRHGTTQHRMARWVWGSLMTRPGFLYDRLHAATLLGLSEAGFAGIEVLVRSARYKGAFWTDDQPRWWISGLRRIAYDLGGDDGVDESQEAGRRIPGVTKADFSRCFVSKEISPAPTVVAFVDSESLVRHAVRAEFAERHPRELNVAPGFETRYVIRKRKGSRG